jgi:hypothetical protein
MVKLLERFLNGQDLSVIRRLVWAHIPYFRKCKTFQPFCFST